MVGANGHERLGSAAIPISSEIWGPYNTGVIFKNLPPVLQHALNIFRDSAPAIGSQQWVADWSFIPEEEERLYLLLLPAEFAGYPSMLRRVSNHWGERDKDLTVKAAVSSRAVFALSSKDNCCRPPVKQIMGYVPTSYDDRQVFIPASHSWLTSAGRAVIIAGALDGETYRYWQENPQVALDLFGQETCRFYRERFVIEQIRKIKEMCEVLDEPVPVELLSAGKNNGNGGHPLFTHPGDVFVAMRAVVDK